MDRPEHSLGQLLRRVPSAVLPAAAAALRVAAVRDDSRTVGRGDVFVAVRGAHADGHAYVDDAVARGAAAIVAERPLAAPVPVIVVDDARAALAEMAAAAFGHPAERLRMVGITGTVGKTTILQMLTEALTEAGIPAGAIGSLGVRIGDTIEDTANTTPGTLRMQESLARMAAAGARVVAMEITSHALVQQRVHGLRCDLGIFTNLTMLEHLEYHGTFRAYVEAKRLFFRHLAADAPLILAGGDRLVRVLAREHRGPRITCGSGRATVSVRRGRIGIDGAAVSLTIHRALPRLDGGVVRPQTLPLRLRTPGRPHMANATLAAVAALCIGADPSAVRRALRRMEPPRRRLQVIRRADPVIIDDTVGHPDSITAVFEVAERLRCRRLHVVFAIRGQRGTEINARDAETLAIWHRRVPITTLIATSAMDSADDRNAVTPAERQAFLGVLDDAGLSHQHTDRLADAIRAVLDAAGPRDVVLLLGAQGMDDGARLAQDVLEGRVPRGARTGGAAEVN